MIDFIRDIFSFAKDKSTSIGLKAGIVITLFGLLVFSDYAFNLTYNYYVNNKTEQLIKLNQLKVIYAENSLELKKIRLTEKRILNQRHYSEVLNEFLESYSKQKITVENPIIKNENKEERNSKRSLFWMVLSSNYFFILLILVLLILPFTGSIHREIKNILGSLAAIIILMGLISLITWIAYKIPLIYNRPYLNYALNFIIHFPLLYFAYRSSKN
ncbi:hypothetical protein [uncultured Winogradskyella sp.]|uniref:hypothetical protein n=1 Tax=uncultured Winogradskyella sp. TaxID=395353 RepID=UPI002613BF16|nr:hypothetical protein [uncultured Winogradskyella sp.]